MPRPPSAVDIVIVRPCLQCGAAVDFDPEQTVMKRGYAVRITTSCPACLAVHRLLVDWDIYGLVRAGQPDQARSASQVDRSTGRTVP